MSKSLNFYRKKIEKIDKKILNEFTKTEIHNSDIEINVNENIIINELYRIDSEYKIDLLEDIKNVVKFIFKNIKPKNNTEKFNLIENITKYISRRIYIGHNIAESKYKIDLINLHSKNKKKFLI